MTASISRHRIIFSPIWKSDSMEFEVRRPVAVSNRMMLNAFMLTAVGAYVIWPQAGVQTSPIWIAIGSVFFLWAAFMVYNMLRPVKLRLTPQGVYAQGIFATKRFGWDALKWVDFTRPAGSALLCYDKPDGKEGFVVLTRKSTTDMDRADALRIVLEYRPDVRKSNPKPFVELRSRA